MGTGQDGAGGEAGLGGEAALGEVQLGFGHIVTLCYRPSTLYQIHQENPCLSF
jgi:hypothetical protein